MGLAPHARRVLTGQPTVRRSDSSTATPPTCSRRPAPALGPGRGSGRAGRPGGRGSLAFLAGATPATAYGRHLGASNPRTSRSTASTTWAMRRCGPPSVEEIDVERWCASTPVSRARGAEAADLHDRQTLYDMDQLGGDRVAARLPGWPSRARSPRLRALDRRRPVRRRPLAPLVPLRRGDPRPPAHGRRPAPLEGRGSSASSSPNEDIVPEPLDRRRVMLSPAMLRRRPTPSALDTWYGLPLRRWVRRRRRGRPWRRPPPTTRRSGTTSTAGRRTRSTSPPRSETLRAGGRPLVDRARDLRASVASGIGRVRRGAAARPPGAEADLGTTPGCSGSTSTDLVLAGLRRYPRAWSVRPWSRGDRGPRPPRSRSGRTVPSSRRPASMWMAGGRWSVALLLVLGGCRGSLAGPRRRPLRRATARCIRARAASWSPRPTCRCRWSWAPGRRSSPVRATWRAPPVDARGADEAGPRPGAAVVCRRQPARPARSIRRGWNSDAHRHQQRRSTTPSGPKRAIPWLERTAARLRPRPPAGSSWTAAAWRGPSHRAPDDLGHGDRGEGPRRLG